MTPELLQDAVTPEHIVEIAGAWITDENEAAAKYSGTEGST